MSAALGIVPANKLIALWDGTRHVASGGVPRPDAMNARAANVLLD
ncbi:MAG: hypothetical protein ABSC46_05665 [Candidatus Limnocylindrales bacterium]